MLIDMHRSFNMNEHLTEQHWQPVNWTVTWQCDRSRVSWYGAPTAGGFWKMHVYLVEKVCQDHERRFAADWQTGQELRRYVC